MSLTVTCTKPDNTTETKTITVTGSAGDVVAIGTSANIYVGVAGVAINSGGAADNLVKIRTKLDRPLAQ